MKSPAHTFTVLGAGSWGTALAMQLARAGRQVTLWSHSAEHVQAMSAANSNERFLPGIPFHANLRCSADLAASIQSADTLLIVVPSHAFRETIPGFHSTTVVASAWGTLSTLAW